MVDEMANLNGKIVLGASWELAVHYGRGETKSQLIAKKNLYRLYFLLRTMNLNGLAQQTMLLSIFLIFRVKNDPKPEFKSDKDDRDIYCYGRCKKRT